MATMNRKIRTFIFKNGAWTTECGFESIAFGWRFDMAATRAEVREYALNNGWIVEKIELDGDVWDLTAYASRAEKRAWLAAHAI
jgi:hypothetical protein